MRIVKIFSTELYLHPSTHAGGVAVWGETRGATNIWPSGEM